MQSMTGFGEGVAANERLRVRARVRSVNHRFLDVQVRLPEEHWMHEGELEARVRARLLRGRVDVRLTTEAVGGGGGSLRVRGEVLATLRQQLEGLRAEGVIESMPPVESLLGLPSVVEIESEATPDGPVLDLLAEALDQALDALVGQREREGRKLAGLLEERGGALSRLVEQIEGRWRELRESAVEDLARRVRELVGEQALPEERLVQEAALLSERADVGEELDRLKVHLGHVGELLATPGSLGKRLDFVSQEILRELNTTASKCRDPQVVAWVVEGKALCEQLREQAQNVE